MSLRTSRGLSPRRGSGRLPLPSHGRKCLLRSLRRTERRLRSSLGVAVLHASGVPRLVHPLPGQAVAGEGSRPGHQPDGSPFAHQGSRGGARVRRCLRQFAPVRSWSGWTAPSRTCTPLFQVSVNLVGGPRVGCLFVQKRTFTPPPTRESRRAPARSAFLKAHPAGGLPPVVLPKYLGLRRASPPAIRPRVHGKAGPGT